MQKSAQLLITSYDQKKVDEGYEVVFNKGQRLKLEVSPPKPQKVKLTKNDPPIWGCKGNDLKQVKVSVSGSLDDLTKLLALKTIEGVYMQLLLK